MLTLVVKDRSVDIWRHAGLLKHKINLCLLQFRKTYSFSSFSFVEIRSCWQLFRKAFLTVKAVSKGDSIKRSLCEICSEQDPVSNHNVNVQFHVTCFTPGTSGLETFETGTWSDLYIRLASVWGDLVKVSNPWRDNLWWFVWHYGHDMARLVRSIAIAYTKLFNDIIECLFRADFLENLPQVPFFAI